MCIYTICASTVLLGSPVCQPRAVNVCRRSAVCCMCSVVGTPHGFLFSAEFVFHIIFFVSCQQARLDAELALLKQQVLKVESKIQEKFHCGLSCHHLRKRGTLRHQTMQYNCKRHVSRDRRQATRGSQHTSRDTQCSIPQQQHRTSHVTGIMHHTPHIKQRTMRNVPKHQTLGA